jgi:putative hydrolase of the HAD superfamily
MERTQLRSHFDALICSHDLGAPKEDARFWPRLAATEPFDPLRTLFVDDSLAVLKAADAYGIRHLLGVRWPDSRGPKREVGDYPAIDSFRDLLPIEP